MTRRRGYVLFLTITLGSVILMLLIAVAPGSQLFRMQTQRERRLAAEDAARGTVDLACSALMYRPDFSANATLAWAPQQPLESSGKMVFDARSPSAYSTSNVYGTDAVKGWDARMVPPLQLHLVGQGKAERTEVVHQAIVQPFQQVLMEDFSKDGRGTGARIDWKAFPNTSGFQILNHYMYLGSTEYQKNKAQWQMAPSDEWDDVDMQVHVAYYGNSNFGLSVRGNEGFECYRLELQPKIGMESIDGIDATVVGVIDAGTTSVPYPQAAQSLKDPLLTVSTDLTEQPAEWTFQVSIEGSQLWLSVWDPALKSFRRIGVPWDLTLLAQPLQAAGHAPTFDKGGVGVWCDFETGIGFTNVIVNRRKGMMRVQSRWEP